MPATGPQQRAPDTDLSYAKCTKISNNMIGMNDMISKSISKSPTKQSKAKQSKSKSISISKGEAKQKAKAKQSK